MERHCPGPATRGPLLSVSRSKAALFGALAALASVLGLLLVSHSPPATLPSHPVGLFTSLPIRWTETETVAAMLHPSPPHWARKVLEATGPIRALNSLTDEGRAGLAGLSLLVMVQPRALSPQENVALDRWVRGGGRLLLFADPMLTAPSTFALGDKRRPRDVVLLSPILTHWGLELRFDEDQPAGQRIVQVAGASIPVDLPGSFAPLLVATDCRTESAGLIARCVIGRGRILAVADAALLEAGDDAERAARSEALGHLIETLRKAP